MVEFRYNALNQLTLFVDAENRRTSYTYAPNGLRNSKATLDISGSWIASITRYYWDRGFIANETINGAHSATNFIGVGGIFGRRNFGPNGCSEQFMMLKNWRGDVVSLVNEDGLLWRYDYSAFGVEREVPGFGAAGAEKPNNPWRFNGEYLCSASGLVYLRNRWYEPRTGRFTQEDPIRWGRNWYRFASNNPIRFVDPTGLHDDAALDQMTLQLPQGATMFTTANSGLHVRASAGGTSMDLLGHGTEVTTTGTRRWANGRWWSQIQHGDGTAYVASEFLSANAPNAPAQQAQAAATPLPPTEIMLALDVTWDDIVYIQQNLTTNQQNFLHAIRYQADVVDRLAILASFENNGDSHTTSGLRSFGFSRSRATNIAVQFATHRIGMTPERVDQVMRAEHREQLSGTAAGPLLPAVSPFFDAATGIMDNLPQFDPLFDFD